MSTMLNMQMQHSFPLSFRLSIFFIILVASVILLLVSSTCAMARESKQTTSGQLQSDTP